MRPIKVKYPTRTRSLKMGDKVFVLEEIRSLDEAIDLICNEMTEEEQLDPFAEDLCPYFGVLWPSSIALSEFISEHPELVKGKKVLELGCGLGLPSLVSSHLGGEVLATDYHPDVEEYYLRNCRHSSVESFYRRLNWREGTEDIGKFDIVIGSDVLYESKHASEVASGLIRFLKPDGIILLSDPLRPYLQKFLTAMKGERMSEEMYVRRAEEKEIVIFKFQKIIEDTE